MILWPKQRRHWMNDKENFNKLSTYQKILKDLWAHQGDPKEMIEEMISIIPADTGKFRNVFPKTAEEFLKKLNQRRGQKNLKHAYPLGGLTKKRRTMKKHFLI